MQCALHKWEIRRFPIAHEALSTVQCIVLLTLWFIIFRVVWDAVTHTALSQYIALQIYHFCCSEMFTQSCWTYQKFSAPTLHAYSARAQLNRALAHLFQQSQGRLNEPCPHTSQTNWALGVRLRCQMYICIYIYIYMCVYVYAHTHTHIALAIQ